LIRVSSITLREIRLPLANPFRTARGIVDVRRVILLTLHDVDGIAVWSECVAESSAGYSRETVDTCWDALRNGIAPAALSERFESVAQVNHRLTTVAPEDPMARAAIEMACWGIQSIQESRSIAQVLANECAAFPRTKVEAGIALGMFSTIDELSIRCVSALDEGYKRIKIKIERGNDVDLAKAALSAVEGQIPITVDANGSYTLADIETLRSLDSLGLGMIEQPLPADDLEGLARLQSQLRTPLCLDESITDAARTREMISRQSARILNLKPGRVGGFSESLSIHSLCRDADIPLWCGGMLETGIGRAYNVALASLPGFTLPGDLSPSARYWERDVIADPWMMADGALSVPLDRIGIGVDADVDFIDNVTTRKTEISAR
jgi:O-succinylbenzoate synthase